MRCSPWLLLLVAGVALAQSPASDTDESAYAPSTLAKIMGGAARSHNDEAELAGPAQWFSTTASYTGQKRRPSGRFKPLIRAWCSSRGQDESMADLYFGGDLPELEFEQGGHRYWIMAGLPGGLGFDVYPPGQKLTIFLQKVGFASGTPVAVLTMAKLPADVTSTTPAPRGRMMRNARMGEGTPRQEGTYKSGTVKFRYAGREYSLPLDLAGRHSIAPGLYSYENGVRTALLEYGAGDAQYLLLRVPVSDGAGASDVVPYLVLNGRIVPPIDLSACRVQVEQVSREGTRGSADCGNVPRAVLSTLTFSAD
ncbi:MAG TPA: hypothetical protein VFP37_14985 [Steroidobacteraceae bacterium]|nr:hypothetical protein [Steroidobacteraceae bacterium]